MRSFKSKIAISLCRISPGREKVARRLKGLTPEDSVTHCNDNTFTTFMGLHPTRVLVTFQMQTLYLCRFGDTSLPALDDLDTSDSDLFLEFF
jgi:hypothetical protein